MNNETAKFQCLLPTAAIVVALALVGCLDNAPTSPLLDVAGDSTPTSSAPDVEVGSATSSPTNPCTTTSLKFARTGGLVDTGVRLQEGDQFTLQASGTIDMWPNCEQTKVQEGYPNLDCDLVQFVTPRGTTVFDPGTPEYPLPGAPVMALVGRIGATRSFLVGDGTTRTAHRDGALSLATNDLPRWKDDDRGEFTVEITTACGTTTVGVP